MLLTFWQQADATTGILRHDFTDPSGDTRFLGDLYQDLSESARKRYALLQTPVFVEEFILERTLDPAIETFGLAKVRMIDPTCGSGHFLLGGFERLFNRWQRAEPATNVVELVRRALAAVHGVDLNPFAVAVARFRLLLAALRAAGIKRVRSAPAWPLNVFTGDALLFGPEPGQQIAGELLAAAIKGTYRTEDAEDATRVLSKRYHAVVGNPPYITIEDKVVKSAIKQRFKSCHGKWVLVVPFFERFFDLAERGDGSEQQPAGFIGKITGNNFMKREFGKKLVEHFIPRWDITHIVDTRFAEIAEHNTPTVVVFGRHQRPVAATIRTVMAIKGESTTPADPAQGAVWRAILNQIDRPGSESDFISVNDTARESFHSHPWSIGGGGAAELKERLDDVGERKLDAWADSIGITAFTLEDDVYLNPKSALQRARFGSEQMRCMIEGDTVRDWCIDENDFAVWPYDADFKICELSADDPISRFLWPGRTGLANNKMFGGKTKVQAGLKWYEFGRLTDSKLRTPLSITFGEVATHNHFVLDRGNKVFKQTAPVIKLPARASEDEYLGLVGLLNSSLACFWLKQVCQAKGTVTGDISSEKGRSEANRYAFNSTAVGRFPIPNLNSQLGTRVITLARELDALGAAKLIGPRAARILNRALLEKASTASMRQSLADLLAVLRDERRRMVLLQEELDWTVYALFGLVGTELLTDFETLSAVRGIEAASRPYLATGSGPVNVPAVLEPVVFRRAKEISTNREVALIENANHKRPWYGRQGVYGTSSKTLEQQLARFLQGWLLERLEERSHPESVAPQLFSVSELAERIRGDVDFQRVAELYTERPDFDLVGLVADLVADESVASLPCLRYKESGLRKRQAWEETWAKQRLEDSVTFRIAAGRTPDELLNPKVQQEISSAVAKQIGEVPAPPKYSGADFLKSSFWRLRGKLDVPKERWISFPGAERAVDQSLVIAWAGWNQLQQAQAIAAHYERLRNEGAPESQLIRLLATLHQLVPWLLQWHNELDPEFQLKMGDYYRTFVDDESRRLHLTTDDLVRLAMTRA
jgi:hypothetical protein